LGRMRGESDVAEDEGRLLRREEER